MSFGRAIILRTAAIPFVERIVRRSFLFRPLVKRFIAGDTLDEAMEAARPLCDKGFGISLDYLGENTKTREEALQACDQYRAILDAIAASSHPDKVNISIKLTQCGLDEGDEFAEENFRGVLTQATPNNTFVRVDMEASEYTERTIAMIERVFPDFKNTGTVLQSYLYRSLDDTERMITLGARIRVVKGAYLEPESVAFASKATVDEKYLEMAYRLMERGNYPAFATHDAEIINTINQYAKEKGIDKSRYEFQMLYGIRRDLQDSLLAEGYNVRVYIPYGDKWYPYFTRRLAERPANGLFILKSLFKG